MDRHTKSYLDLVHPNVKTKVAQSLEWQKLNHDKFTKDCAFDMWMTKYFWTFTKELQGIVTGPLLYKMKLNDSSIICHHIDHSHIHHSPPQQDISAEAAIDDSFMFPQHKPNAFPNGTAENAPQQSPILCR